MKNEKLSFVPVVAAHQRGKYHRSGFGYIFAVLLLILGIFTFLLFDIFFLTFYVAFIPIGFMIFLIIFIVIVTISMSMRQTNTLTREQRKKLYQHQPQKESQYRNPYVISTTSQMQYEKSVYREVKREIPVVSDINYCSYCGTKIDGDATFCYQCGVKL